MSAELTELERSRNATAAAVAEVQSQMRRAERAEAEREALKATIERVRAEHHPVACDNMRHDGGRGQHCAVCEYDDLSGNIWPCPTIRALAAPDSHELQS